MSTSSLPSQAVRTPGTLPTSQAKRPAITLRSVMAGLLGVLGICALTPYNDYALNNTFLVGNNLPLGLISATFLFTVLVNGPLSRWAPRYAFSTAEVAVAFSMILIGCALPSSGLMRFFLPSLVAPFWHAQLSAEYQAMLKSMHLPAWLFPASLGEIDQSDPLVAGYFNRWTGEGPPPYGAWLRPLAMWGLFVFALYGAILCLMTLLRRQWMENERVAFPLAQVQYALIEQPEPGRLLNTLMAARSFWVAMACVMAVRLLNGAAEYWPASVPKVPLGFNFASLFSEGPFAFAASYFSGATLYLIVIGITFFIPSHISLSLWLTVVIDQVIRMGQGAVTGEVQRSGDGDQHVGALLAVAASILWIGRAHWGLVIRQAIRGPRDGEPQGRYLSYRFAAFGLLGCAAVMIGWLVMAGCQLWGAAVLVVLLLMLFVVIARIVAESGLIYGQVLLPLYKPFQLLAHYGVSKPVTLETFFHSGMLQVKFYDFREPPSVYTSHALVLSEKAVADDRESDQQSRRWGRWYIALLMVSLVLGYVTSAGSMLVTEYHVAVTRDDTQAMPINHWGGVEAPRRYMMEPTAQYHQNRTAFRHDPLTHIAAGFTITSALTWLRLNVSWWPLHPIGYVLLPTTPGKLLWFSVLVGWLCKTLCLRLGGTMLYRRAQPAFMGVIVGDALAAGLWLMVCLVCSLFDIPYHAITILPQ